MNTNPNSSEEFEDNVDAGSEDGTEVTAEETAGEEAEAGEAAPEAKPAVRVEAAANEGMSTMQKAVVVVVAVLAVGAGLVFWKSNVGGHGSADFSTMSAKEMQMLLKDLDPMQLQMFAQDPERKKQLVENISQLLSLASAAQKEGVDSRPEVRAELEDIRISLVALNYDRKLNSDKGPMPPFGFIGEDRVKEFWGEDGEAPAPAQVPQDANSNTSAPAANTNPAPAANSEPAPPSNSNTVVSQQPAAQPVAEPAAEAATETGSKKEAGVLESALDVVGLGWIVGNAEARRHEAEFDIYLKHKLALLKERGQITEGQEPSAEELKQLRDRFAKTRIYYEEAEEKIASASSLPEDQKKEWEEFEESSELQAKLQQAQFLVSIYVDKYLRKKLEVTEEDVKKYIEEHPELLKLEEKQAKAEEVLKRVKEGEDFAKLAEEFSEDPGSKENGGLYEGINKGQFAPEFEAAALALEPGQIAEKVVKTDFGFHVIKLEKKGEAKGADGVARETYDVRHILISTMLKDPDNPLGREMPPEQYVKATMEKEKQEKILEEIKAANPVHIADFEIPQPSAEAMERLRQQQQQQIEMLKQQQEQQQNTAPAGEGEETPRQNPQQ